MEDELYNVEDAVAHIVTDFENEGDFEFMGNDEIRRLTARLVAVDFAYMEEIGDDVYDEDAVYERLYAAAEETSPQYKTYLMRFVDDYMDFMEQYLVSIGAVEWE